MNQWNVTYGFWALWRGQAWEDGCWISANNCLFLIKGLLGKTLDFCRRAELSIAFNNVQLIGRWFSMFLKAFLRMKKLPFFGPRSLVTRVPISCWVVSFRGVSPKRFWTFVCAKIWHKIHSRDHSTMEISIRIILNYDKLWLKSWRDPWSSTWFTGFHHFPAEKGMHHRTWSFDGCTMM